MASRKAVWSRRSCSSTGRTRCKTGGASVPDNAVSATNKELEGAAKGRESKTHLARARTPCWPWQECHRIERRLMAESRGAGKVCKLNLGGRDEAIYDLRFTSCGRVKRARSINRNSQIVISRPRQPRHSD